MQYQPWNIINDLNSFIENATPRYLSGDDTKVATSHWLPAVDIKEEPNQYLIYADLPGVDPQQIEISMENKVLEIKGSRSDVAKVEKKDYYRMERLKGDFYRRFTLPDNADGDNIKAVSRNGVLTVSIPKKKVAVSKKIEVEASE